MLKKLLTPIFLLVCLLSIPSFFYFYFSTQPAFGETVDNRINYELPYPGMLPGNPLYSVKSARDSIMQWMMRDNIKKAQLRLQISDKHVRGAQMLLTENDYERAEDILLDGEQMFEKAIEDALNAKEQGASPTSEFKEKLKFSNLKHKQIIDDILKTVPPQERDGFREPLRQNRENAEKLAATL